MKIRNGFVSNSSSSSFIIGIAKIADEKKLNKILKKVPEEHKNDFVIGTFDEIANSSIVNKVISNYTLTNPKTNKVKHAEKVEQLVVQAPVNDFIAVNISTDSFNRDQIDIVKVIKTKDGDISNIKYNKQSAKWFAICVGNDEGDGGDSPFYKYTKWQNFTQEYLVNPINWLSKTLLYPIIKVLNKILKKNWFYPYIILLSKSGYDKVKDHNFFEKEWQKEIVKAFEYTDSGYIIPNQGIFSDEYQSCSYKIGACRNG